VGLCGCWSGSIRKYKNKNSSLHALCVLYNAVARSLVRIICVCVCVCACRNIKEPPRKVMAHTALSDIRESIEELQYYRTIAIFKAHSGKGSTKGKGR
jgi:oligoribonuclease (3'-5' exoribonuclease)